MDSHTEQLNQLGKSIRAIERESEKRANERVKRIIVAEGSFLPPNMNSKDVRRMFAKIARFIDDEEYDPKFNIEELAIWAE